MTRVKLEVYVNLDPTPGPFHSVDSARNIVHGILQQQIPHYNPMVSIAPTEKATWNPDDDLVQEALLAMANKKSGPGITKAEVEIDSANEYIRLNMWIAHFKAERTDTLDQFLNEFAAAVARITINEKIALIRSAL